MEEDAEIRNLPQLNEIYDYCQNLKFEETPQYGLKIGGPLASAVRQLQEFHPLAYDWDSDLTKSTA